MAWEPDSEEIRLRKQNKEIDKIKEEQFYINTGIETGDNSSNAGTVNQLAGINFGVVGDALQETANVFTTIGTVGIVGGFIKILVDTVNDPDPNVATIHILNGGGTNNEGFVGQKVTLKPEPGKSILLKDNPTSNPSTSGNLILGFDITLTDTQVITLRYQEDVQFSDNVGGWIVDSAGGSGGAGGTLPSGSVDNDHLEWDSTSSQWITQTYLEFNTGNLADSGQLRFVNDDIMLSARNFGDTGNVELKLNSSDILDITNSNNDPISVSLRAQDAVQPDATSTWTQNEFNGTDSLTTFSFPHILAIDRGVTQKIRIPNDTDIEFFEVSDNFGFGKTAPGVVNFGEVASVIFTNFGAGSGNIGKVISRLTGTGIHYDIEDSTDIHSFRIGGATPAEVFEISSTEVTLYSPLDFIPSTDGTLNIGSAATSFNDINADRVILRHNDGVDSTLPSIGRSSANLRLNTPTGNKVEFDVNGTEEFFMDNLKFAVKNLNHIAFLDSGDNTDARIELIAGQFFNFVTLEDFQFESDNIVPSFRLRGKNETADSTAFEILFLGESNTGVQREYGRIEVEQEIVTNAGEYGIMDFELISNGTERTLLLQLDALFNEVFIPSGVTLNINGTENVNQNYIQFDGMTAPSQTTGEPKLFADSGNSDHLSIRSGDGSLIDLESGGTSTLEGTLEYGIWTSHQTTQFNFDVWHSSSMAGRSTQNATLSSDQLWYVPILVGRDVTLDRIGIFVATLEVETAYGGIYSNRTDQNYPNTLLQSSGAQTINTTGIWEFGNHNFNETLTPGLYWLAMFVDGTLTSLELAHWQREDIPAVGWVEDTTEMDAVNAYLTSKTVGDLPSTAPNDMSATQATNIPAIFAKFS